MQKTVSPSSSSIQVYFEDKNIVLRKLDIANDKTHSTLTISKTNGAVSIESERQSNSVNSSQPTLSIYGIMGMIELLSGSFLVFVTERTFVCRFDGHDIWRVADTQILPINEDGASALGDVERADERKYVDLLRTFLDSDYLYYSETLDLTRSQQKQHQQSADSNKGGSNEAIDLLRADKVNLLFCVNRHIVAPFMGKEILPTITDFCLFCIEGFVEFQEIPVRGPALLCFGLISRRCAGRVGTRYHSRGIDDLGHVSNCVETEQILSITNDSSKGEKQIFSHVQVRGSIPIYWRQNINSAYKPPLEIYKHGQEVDRVFAVHFDALKAEYGSIIALNLVNQRGWEGKLAKEFAIKARHYAREEEKGASATFSYHPFDFHAQCPGMNWGNARLLLESLDSSLHAHSFHHTKQSTNASKSPVVKKQQCGIIRTNCIDCLDRTNVVQGMVGRSILAQQLKCYNRSDADDDASSSSSMNGEENSKKITITPTFSQIHKQIWADNGDAISTQYSGTGALKADFTRTGKRTLKGLLADGTNSIMRYWLNNYSDGVRQDAMDLFYGHYTPRLGQGSPFIWEGGARPFLEYSHSRVLMVAPMIVALGMLVLVWSLMVSSQRIVALAMAVVMMVAGVYLRANGVHYVQFPRLRPPPRIHQHQK